MKYTAWVLLAVATISFTPIIAAADINICSKVANGVFLADLTNCSQYYVCWDEIAYPGTCPDALLFSPDSQTCNYAADATCVQQCTSALTTFAYDKTCTKYVMCFDSTPVVQECLDGLQYNAETDRCDFQQNVDCQANMCSAVNDPNNIVFLSSHADCAKYFICYNGQAVPRECGSGLFFNIDKQGCDYKANVDCNISKTSRLVLPYAKMPPIKANIVCPAEGSHFLPNENDGNSYYFCMNGNGVVLTCSPGLVFDKTMESCRDPKNVQ